VLHGCSLQLEVEAAPGAVAVPGEELQLDARLHNGSDRTVVVARVEAVSTGEAELEPDNNGRSVAPAGTLHTTIAFRVPLPGRGDVDLAAAAFHGDRFVPPVRLRAVLLVDGVEVPLIVDAAVELRPAVQLSVVPRALLLSRSSRSVKFTVDVQRNCLVPVDGTLEARAPSGYLIDGNRQAVMLRDLRGDSFRFELHAPAARKSGVDLVRIVLGDNQIALPVHKVDVDIDAQLRVGIVRGNDDTLTLVVGIGGFGLHWSELTDADLAVRDLAEFDTIVVDFRGLRDRPAARRSFGRLLEFAAARGKRLVVFYHKDVEFNPLGEDFRGAPFVPFRVGKSRVTRPDAPVRVLRPDHVLLTRPNVVSASDWDAWEQERGLHFPSAYTEQYEELLEMNDPGLPPERSALLYARTGSGEYVYCALALYRQLKKLHPGAVRLLANLLTPQPR
ncbi:MAG TPA: hypothetical protein VK348_02355, partial [Planctomycetota bacterium]|nr:hypothetical protein [Planctomycetota bacterium]